MKKSDIKNGMHVITNDGTEYVIISDVEAFEQNVNTAKTIMVQFNGQGWMPFDEYDEDLHYHDPDGDEDEYDEDGLYDIKAVYVPRYYSYTLASVSSSIFDFAKVWERPKRKKMTKIDIEKELGYEIEIID